MQLPTINQWKEKTLIENQLKSPLLQANSLCAYHRLSLGIGWKQPNRCQHYKHKFQADKKAHKLRCIPFNTLAAYNENNPPLPVGAAFCFSHLKTISCEDQKNDKSEEINGEIIQRSMALLLMTFTFLMQQ